MPKDLNAQAQMMIDEEHRLLLAIKVLRLKPRLTDRELRQLAELKTEYLQWCPPIRFDWQDGRPARDIVKRFTLSII
jgi:hypothetical protein